jgi:hypothetical protein
VANDTDAGTTDRPCNEPSSDIAMDRKDDPDMEDRSESISELSPASDRGGR